MAALKSSTAAASRPSSARAVPRAASAPTLRGWCCVFVCVWGGRLDAVGVGVGEEGGGERQTRGQVLHTSTLHHPTNAPLACHPHKNTGSSRASSASASHPPSTPPPTPGSHPRVPLLLHPPAAGGPAAPAPPPAAPHSPAAPPAPPLHRQQQQQQQQQQRWRGDSGSGGGSGVVSAASARPAGNPPTHTPATPHSQ